MGVLVCFAILFLYTAVTCTSVGANFWLSSWADDALITNDTTGTPNDKRNLRLGVYGALGVAQGNI